MSAICARNWNDDAQNSPLYFTERSKGYRLAGARIVTIILEPLNGVNPLYEENSNYRVLVLTSWRWWVSDTPGYLSWRSGRTHRFYPLLSADRLLRWPARQEVNNAAESSLTATLWSGYLKRLP